MLACDPHQCLGMGFSTIDAHDHLVGRHGEGPKPAALVPFREGCQTASWRDAARQIQRKWEEALRKQEDTILPLLLDLLPNNARSADAEMIGPLLEPPAARRIWQYLLRESVDKEFFYSERSDVYIDREHYPGQPRQAPGTPASHAVADAACTLPHPDRRRGAARAFKDAKPYTIPDTTFARTVDRALRACSALLKFTDHIQVFYVRGLAGKVDVYFDKGQAEIQFMHQIGRRLRYLPHSIKLMPYPGGILVSWEDNETEAYRTLGSSGPEYHVVLHDDNCANTETALIHDKAALPSEVVPRHQSLAWFCSS
ncbi:hypothetical protein BDV33DRAFT_198956 [Aspergillus novoparasiticus]|uniref:Uncharacterized protein n=1 Tax=Aspergillus novoparasiticus TaxID=986946 RepID=A0A5N6F7U8_9EURO|nr:hypothetical protein BDV33DRAFT_198956 [Aspergillus novoparasiticus]